MKNCMENKGTAKNTKLHQNFQNDIKNYEITALSYMGEGFYRVRAFFALLQVA